MITFDKPAGQRVLRKHFYGIQTKDRLWWSDRRKKWVKNLDGDSGTNIVTCRSYKAFLRHIRKHPELTQATLCSYFTDYDIHYTKDA